MRLVTCALVASALAAGSAAAVPLYFPGQISVPVPAPTGTAVSLDVTGEGRLDLLAGLDDGRVVIVNNGGEGRFSVLQVIDGLGGGTVVRLAVVTLDAGGLPSVAVLTRNPDRLVLLDQTRASPLLAVRALVELEEDPGDLAAGLRADDGGVQLAVALPGVDRWILAGEREGDWAGLQEVAAGDRPVAIATLDLDGDDEPEVVTADNGALAPGLSVYARDGGGIWARTGGIAVDGAPTSLFPFTDPDTGAVTVYVAYGDRARIDRFTVTAGTLVPAGAVMAPLTASGLHVARLAGGETGMWTWNGERGVVDYFRDPGTGWTFAESFYAGGAVGDGRLTDLNQDAWPDLLIANGASAAVGLLFGNNLRSFRAYLATPLPSQPSGARLFDEDRDGELDYVVSCFGSRSLEMLRGDGRGHLIADPAPLVLPDAPLGFALLRADGDTLTDLAITLPEADETALLRRLPGGGYAEMARVPCGNFPVKVMPGDLDGDGHGDLTILNLLAQSFTLAYGAGDGTFPDVRTLTPFSLLEDLALIDLNADGLPEIVATNGNDLIFALRNLGGRAFGTPSFQGVSGQPANLATGDLDGDHDLDLVLCQRGAQALALYENRGTGLLHNRLIGWDLGGRPGSVTVADLDLDGALDIVVALIDRHEVAVLLNRGAFELTPPIRWVSALNPGALATGDLNGDDVPDIALLDQALDLALTMLNVEPNPVPVSAAPLTARCDEGRLEIRLAPPPGAAWTLEVGTAAGWSVLAADGRAWHGDLTRADEGWRLRLDAAAAAAGGLAGESAPWLRLTAAPAAGGPWLARAPAGCAAGPAATPPAPLALLPPHPNPFNPGVACRFRLARPGAVRAAVLDAAGRVVADLGERWYDAGEHVLAWDGRGARGRAASGTYVLSVTAGGRTLARKLTLLQ